MTRRERKRLRRLERDARGGYPAPPRDDVARLTLLRVKGAGRSRDEARKRLVEMGFDDPDSFLDWVRY